MSTKAVLERINAYIEAMRELSEAEGASLILQSNKGDPRAAEADAWELYNLVAGGTWGLRPKGGQYAANAQRAMNIAWHIFSGTEIPQVPRTEVKHPAYAWSNALTRGQRAGGFLSKIGGGR